MFLFNWYILDPIFWNSLKNIHKIDYSLHVPSTTSSTSPTSRFLFHISLNPIDFTAIQDINMIGMGLIKLEFAVWPIDEVFLIKNVWLCWPSAQKQEENSRKTLIYGKMMLLWRHHDVIFMCILVQLIR